LEVSKINSIFAPIKVERYKMDKRFTPRSNEEMLAAVRAFQARQKAFMERMDAKLEKEIYQEEMA
jgi:hypothetical protein